MNKFMRPIMGILLLLSVQVCFAQKNIVSVNPLTGTASAYIPVYTIAEGGVSETIALAYSATGIKPKDVENTAGMGWQLIAGGSVSRLVRGLPDDIKQDNGGNTLLGWMYNSNQGAIGGLTINNDGTTCSKETTDISNITIDFGNLYDTEPDMFYVNAPGLSCQMVFDQSVSKFRPIPYQDLNINYSTDLHGFISSFTITNDKGIKYVFSVPDTVAQITDLVHNTSGVVNYFKNTYSQYRNKMVYHGNWYLSSMMDVSRQGLIYHYKSADPRSSTDPVNLFIAGASTPTVEYNIRQTVTPQTLTSIDVGSDDTNILALTLTWSTNTTGLVGYTATGQPFINTISGRGKSLQFNYSTVLFTQPDSTKYQRLFLRSFIDNGCGTPVNYQFGYAGETSLSGDYYSTVLPDSLSTKFDYWGYYNSLADSTPKAVYVNPANAAYQRYAICSGTTAGSDYKYTIGVVHAVADTTNVAAGTLNQVTYAEGGSTNITYQSNDYLDVPSGTVNYGGGIRVRKVVDYDGINTANNITHSYTYLNSSGVSSGKPVSLPAYAFTIPYSGTDTAGVNKWKNGTAISDVDLSSEDHTIMYQYVTESQTGAGKTVYQYYVPATNWDTSAIPACDSCTTADWAPTENYVGRTSCSATYGPVKNDIFSYPFVPNTNYDFERGLPLFVTTYNDAGSKVSESDFTYKRSFSPAVIPAFKFEYNQGSTGVMGYSKYNIYAATSELTAQVVSKVYDPSATSLSSTVNYYYTSANHKLVTQEKTTNSDSTVLINNIKYTKDYTASSGVNPNVTAIYNLQQQNINVPVETWTQLKRGATTYTTNASLTYFNADSINIPVTFWPSQQFRFTATGGVTDFAPFTISGQTTTADSRYVPIANYTAYDDRGALLTADDAHHHVRTTIKDYNSDQSAATISNAAYNEIVVEDFDSQIHAPNNYFNPSGTVTLLPVGHTGHAITLTSSQTLATGNPIIKNTLTQNCILSMWINSSAAGHLATTLTPSSGTVVTSNKAFTNTGGKWQYFEWKIPISGTTTAFNYKIGTSANIGIDDILFYPENAEVTTFAHDSVTYFQTAQTNTNGISTYYQYDQWGRLIYAFDQFKNILKKDTYITPADVQYFTGDIHVSPPSGTSINTNTQVSLYTTNPGSCYASNTTYTWNYGDGTPAVTTATYTSPVHLYTMPNTYTASMTLNSPLIGPITKDTTFSVSAGPNCDIGYINNTTSDGGIISIVFTDDDFTTYSFTSGQLAAGTATIPKSIYTVKVTMAVGTSQYNATTDVGYNSVALIGDAISTCQNFSATRIYTFNDVELGGSHYLNLVINKTVCP